MIEIIRGERQDGTTEKRGLPKDIKQIGKPDIGDRIYVEDQVYQFLHPYGSMEEKQAYVLLGKFENCAGRQCVFVEAAIRLEEITFEGELPVWNDHTWAYIYKQLRHEYDSMVIVGWAMDIQGRLPNMTMRLELLHQNNFGGAHQVLFLMDNLEREEAFYGSRSGHLSRREGFYIYYEKSKAAQCQRGARVVENTEEDLRPAGDVEQTEQMLAGFDESAFEDVESSWSADVSEHGVRTADGFFARRENGSRGNYRKQLAAQEERGMRPSYASTFLLVTVICALGITAYLNHEKMAAMEETLVQMSQRQQETEQAPDGRTVAVETVAGEVERQQAPQGAADEPAGTPQDVAGEPQGTPQSAEAVDPGNGGELAGGTSAPGETSGAEAAVNPDPATGAGAAVPPAAGGAGGTDAAGSVDNASGGSGNAAAQGGQADAPAVTEAQAYLNQGYYVVQKGDSLVGICSKIYQTTAMMDKLCEVNGIADKDAIYAGQYLKLPK